MKASVKLLLIASILLTAFSSCNKLPEGSKALDKDSAQFIGVWAVSSDNPAREYAYWIFYDDGTAKKVISEYSYSNYYEWKSGGFGKWSYDKDTKILATTVDLFQVQITMVSENEWSAIGTDGKYHYTGTLYKGSEISNLYMFLIGTKWEGSKFGKLAIDAPFSGYAGKNSSSYLHTLWFSTPSVIKETEKDFWTNLYIYDYEDQLHYSLFRRYYSTTYGREQYLSITGEDIIKITKFELTNPLSPSSCRLIFNVTYSADGNGLLNVRKYDDTYKLKL